MRLPLYKSYFIPLDMSQPIVRFTVGNKVVDTAYVVPCNNPITHCVATSIVIVYYSVSEKGPEERSLTAPSEKQLDGFYIGGKSPLNDVKTN